MNTLKAVKRSEITKGKSTRREKFCGMRPETLGHEGVMEKRSWQRRLRTREQWDGGVGFWNQEKRVDQEEGPAAVSDAAGVTDGSTGTF